MADKIISTPLKDGQGKILPTDLKDSVLALFDYALKNTPTATNAQLTAIARLRAQVTILLNGF